MVCILIASSMSLKYGLAKESHIVVIVIVCMEYLLC